MRRLILLGALLGALAVPSSALALTSSQATGWENYLAEAYRGEHGYGWKNPGLNLAPWPGWGGYGWGETWFMNGAYGSSCTVTINVWGRDSVGLEGDNFVPYGANPCPYNW